MSRQACWHSWVRVIPIWPWRRPHDRCAFCGERRPTERRKRATQ